MKFGLVAAAILAGAVWATSARAVVIAGQVRDVRGNGISSVDVDIDDAATGVRTPYDAATNAFGFYFIDVPPGVYHVGFEPPLRNRLVANQVPFVSVRNDTPLDMVLLDGVLLGGTVLGPSGSPVDSADIDVDIESSGERVRTPNDDTGATGLFQVVVPAGRLRVSVTPRRGSGLAPLLVEHVDVTRDTALALRLESGVHISGTLRDPSQFLLSGVDIDIAEFGSGAQVPLNNDRSDATGAFDVLVRPGRFRVALIPPIESGLAATLLTDVEVVRDTVIDVALAPGARLDLVVRSPFGVGVQGADLDFVRPDGLAQPVWEDVTDGAGMLTVLLPPGDYRVSVTPPNGTGLAPLLELPLAIAADRSVEWVVPLIAPPASLRIASLAPNPARGGTANFVITSPVGATPVGSVIDARGRRVGDLQFVERAPGVLSAAWNGHDRDGRRLPASVYYLAVRSPGQSTVTGRLVWIP